MEHDHVKHASAISVLVADNSQFHTQLLVGALNRDPDLQVISSELNAASLVGASSSQKIDIFVLSAFANGDAQLGFKVLQQVRETYSHARAVMLLDSSKPDAVLAAFRAGARGVFDHQDSSDLLCRCIHRVHEGQAWVSREQMTLVLETLASTPKIRAVDGKGMNLLSKREVEVVRCLSEGLTNREIAERMGLSQHTIKNYLFRIFDKLGVSNRIELLFMTLSQGKPAPILQGLLMDPTEGFDEATLASCQKAAGDGVVAAQLALARMYGMRRDVAQAYKWFSIAIDQITRTKNSLKKAMNAAQLAEAEHEVLEWLNKSRQIEPDVPARTSLRYKPTREISDSSLWAEKAIVRRDQ